MEFDLRQGQRCRRCSVDICRRHDGWISLLWSDIWLFWEEVLSVLVQRTGGEWNLIKANKTVFTWLLKSSWFCIDTLHDWLKKLTPLFYPIRSKTKTSCDSLEHIFPRFALRQLLSATWLHLLWVFISLRTGSPLSHTREWRREKRSGGKESGEEVPLSCLATSPLDFALAAMPCALCPPTWACSQAKFSLAHRIVLVYCDGPEGFLVFRHSFFDRGCQTVL